MNGAVLNIYLRSNFYSLRLGGRRITDTRNSILIGLPNRGKFIIKKSKLYYKNKFITEIEYDN